MSPRRTTIVPVALAAALAVPAAAQAKQVQQVKACGTGGECRTVDAHGDDGMGLMPSGRGGGPPDHRAPFYRLTLVIGAGGSIEGRTHAFYAPSLRLVSFDEPGAAVQWETPPAPARRLADRAVRGLPPLSAARMPLGRLPQAAVATAEPARPARQAATADGPPWAVIGLVAAALAAAGGLGARLRAGYRSRRANAHDASAPTATT
jgi:hypothetical protein